MVPHPSAWPSPTSQMHTSQGSVPGWKLSPGPYFRPSCSQSWGWGKSRIGPGGLQAGSNARGGLLCPPGTPAPRIRVCTKMGATSGKACLCRPTQCQGREMLTRHYLPATHPPQAPSTRASRAAVTGPLAGMGTGADALDSGAGDNTLVTHAGGAGAVRRLPGTAFRVLLPVGQAACPRWAGVTLSLGSVCPRWPTLGGQQGLGSGLGGDLQG